MGNIKATFSAVDVYASDCSENYVVMINIANDIISRIEKLLVEVQEDYETISKQIVRAQMMQDEVASKVTSYQNDMNSAYAEAQSWQAEIDYLYSNPDTVTTTDDDGNESTEEVYDYAAIHAAERKRDEAMQTYYYYSEKYEAAYEVYLETTNTISNFEKIKTAIHVVGESIQNDIYEIKKYISAIGDEAEYNTHALSGVIGSLEAYLASKAIFLPAGAHYEDFSSLGGTAASANHSSGSSKSDINTVDLQAINHMYTDTTVQTALGIAGRVAVSGFGMATGLSDPTGSASATAAQAFQIAGPVAIEAFTRMVRDYINVNSTNTDIFYRDHFMRTQDGIPITPEQGREIAINEMVSTLTGNSESVINVIANEEQLQIYMEAGLEYSVVNNRECLVRDIDPDFVDKKTGLTNRELMLLGRAPYDSDTGERIELHHMGQTFDAPFAELAENSEHGDGNFNTLHQSRSESWRKDPALCNEYARQRRMHWIERGRNL